MRCVILSVAVILIGDNTLRERMHELTEAIADNREAFLRDWAAARRAATWRRSWR